MDKKEIKRQMRFTDAIYVVQEAITMISWKVVTHYPNASGFFPLMTSQI